MRTQDGDRFDSIRDVERRKKARRRRVGPYRKSCLIHRKRI